MSLGIVRVLGIILFAYLTWRNLRENYEEDKIVTYSWVALLSFFVGGRIIYGLVNFGVWNDSWMSWFSVWNKPGMDYTGGFLALFIASIVFAKMNSWKIIPFCEDGLINELVLLIFLTIDELIRTKFDLKIGVYLLFLILMTFFVNFIKGKYRSLVWYKSGKKGFTFLSTMFLSFLILGFLGLFFQLNIIYSILYWVISLISLVELCILGDVYEKRK
jgi:hypothetical protein